MENLIMDYKKQIEILEKAFDILNAEFYKNELVRPVITYGYDSSYSTFGWCSCGKVWNNENYEINITSNTIKHNKYGYVETLLHEMTHLYAIHHGIEDTSNKGYYHNKNFKKIAENHGLVCEYGKYGWNKTSLSSEAVEFCESLEKLDMFRWNPKDDVEIVTVPPEKPIEKKYQRWIRLTCPKCSNMIKVVDTTIAIYCECGEKYTR